MTRSRASDSTSVKIKFLYYEVIYITKTGITIIHTCYRHISLWYQDKSEWCFGGRTLYSMGAEETGNIG